MKVDSGRALDRVDIAESRLEETGTEREREIERGSRAKAAVVRKLLSSALPSDEIVGNRDFPVCRRVTGCRFDVDT